MSEREPNSLLEKLADALELTPEERVELARHHAEWEAALAPFDAALERSMDPGDTTIRVSAAGAGPADPTEREDAPDWDGIFVALTEYAQLTPSASYRDDLHAMAQSLVRFSGAALPAASSPGARPEVGERERALNEVYAAVDWMARSDDAKGGAATGNAATWKYSHLRVEDVLNRIEALRASVAPAGQELTAEEHAALQRVVARHVRPVAPAGQDRGPSDDLKLREALSTVERAKAELEAIGVSRTGPGGQSRTLMDMIAAALRFSDPTGQGCEPDTLAQIIRTVDGSNNLGAAALAEHIVAAGYRRFAAPAGTPDQEGTP